MRSGSWGILDDGRGRSPGGRLEAWWFPETAALLAAVMVRTGLWLDQDRVLPWVHAAVPGLAWEWPLQTIILVWRALPA